MRTEDADLRRTAYPMVPGIAKRISWAAVFAGLAVALVIELLLGLLGIGIGATTVDPMAERNPMEGLGIGTGIWLFLSTIIALFVGGWVAGRLAAFPRKLDNALHGVVTWAAATLVTVYLLGTALGSLMGGAFNLLGQGFSAVSPQIREAAGAAMQRSTGVDMDALRQQARTTLQQRAKNPENVQATENQLFASLQKLFSGQATQADRQAVISQLVQNTNMSQQEAEQTVQNWEQKFQQTKVQVEQQARETGQAAAKGVAVTAWVLFGVLLLGAISAAFGGSIATPRELVRPATEVA